MALVGQTEPSEIRAPLSRERVLQTAIALADEHGLEAFSMRKLANELGVEAMSLYHHVAQQGPVARRDDRHRLQRDRAAVDRRGVADGDAQARPLDPRGAQPPPLGGRADGGAQHPRAGEPPPPQRGARVPARRRLLAGDDRPRLFGPGRLHLRLRAPAGRHDARDLRGLRSDRRAADGDYKDVLADYPHLVEVVGGHVATAGYDYETEFLFGLDLILAGLDELRER